MRIDLRKQLHAYGEPIIISGEKDREAVGIICRRQSGGSTETYAGEVSERGVCYANDYNLWFMLCDPSDSREDINISHITIRGRDYKRISGKYDSTFCCYRFIVREVGR